jgi:hypothetical protein
MKAKVIADIHEVSTPITAKMYLSFPIARTHSRKVLHFVSKFGFQNTIPTCKTSMTSIK